MNKLLTPPVALSRRLSLVGTWYVVISRRDWWRSGPSAGTFDAARVQSWIRIQQALATDINGPWALEEADLRFLAEAARCSGDELRGLTHDELGYQMLVIAAVDAAILSAPDAAPQTASTEYQAAAAE